VSSDFKEKNQNERVEFKSHYLIYNDRKKLKTSPTGSTSGYGKRGTNDLFLESLAKAERV